jgi:hypothetical protein
MLVANNGLEDAELLRDDLGHLAQQIGSLLAQEDPNPATLAQVERTVKSLAIGFGVYGDAWAAEDASLKRDGLKRVLVPIDFIGAWHILH